MEIINPYLNQEIRFVRQFFIGAAVHAQDETLLDRLEVVWMWLNKDPESVEHEYIVIETRDRKEGASRLFILDRMIHKAGAPLDRSLGDENKKKKGIVHLILQKFPWLLYLIPPSRSVTPIPGPSMEAMEEGLLQTSTSISTSTSTSTSSSSLQPPSSSFLFDHQSLPDSDTLSVSATKFAQSLYKGSERASFDRFQGENALFGDRYAFGQNARWLKPKTLTLFELIILAGAVHRFAPEYSTLERNCFWFCNVIFDSVQKVFHDSDSKSPDDSERKTKFTPIDHDTLISGRWKGIKVSDTNEDDISTIIGYFHEGYRTAITEVGESSKVLIPY